MKRIILIAVVIAMLTSVALFAQDQNENANRPVKGQRQFISMKEQLNLTEQQIAKMDKLRTDHQKEMIQKNADLKTKEIEKTQALKDEDYKKAKALNKDIAKIYQDIDDKRIELHENMQKELTADQKKIVKENPHHMNGMGYGMFRNDGFGNSNSHNGRGCSERNGKGCRTTKRPMKGNK
ncbi:MAG TPA: hypothetical protein PKZ69_00675 [Candidatus Cloacimonadota bacterium]|nr:hypothetical protein [Candidatus Cloacimonadota bacterium]HOQ80818.1 hypothetical protein [Candidatus Cloacimonadota bacterium]HPK40108.1 hypothetical protein [Candidatus Cloacimonadota bacterium]